MHFTIHSQEINQVFGSLVKAAMVKTSVCTRHEVKIVHAVYSEFDTVFPLCIMST